MDGILLIMDDLGRGMAQLKAEIARLTQENAALRQQTDPGAPLLTEGDIRVYAVAGGFVVADGGGWINAVFDSPEAALAAARGQEPERASSVSPSSTG